MDIFVLQYLLVFSSTWDFKTSLTMTWLGCLGKRKALVNIFFTKAHFNEHIAHTDKDRA